MSVQPVPPPPSGDFVHWALDPARSLEETYLVECLLGPGLGHWRHQHKIQQPFDWERIQAERKQRRLNPAYRPVLVREDVERAAQGLPNVTFLNLSDSTDRPVRTLAGIEFAPNVATLFIHSEGVSDWSPLAALPKLNHLSISDNEAEDFRGLGACRQVPKLIIYTARPWPRLAGWEGMVQLESLDWHGNLLALEEVPRLERVREAKLVHSYHANLPLRDATRLPAMPALESLTLDSIHRLAGLERYPALRNLTLAGPIRDLAPLATLERLTHLSITSDELQDLTPLSRLPELRFLRIVGEQPLDWFVLADLPRLHEIEVAGCDLNTEEVATLQEVLPSWDADFRAETARSLAPVRLVVQHDRRELPGIEEFTAAGPAGWDGNAMMRDSENRWHAKRFAAVLGQLLGDRKWGRVAKPIAWGFDFKIDIEVTTFAGAMRLAEIVETVRALLAESRFRRCIHLIVNTNPQDDYDPDEKMTEEEQAESDRQDAEYHARLREERAKFLERQHRLRLQQQEGAKIQPEEFAPEAEPPAPEETAAEEADGPPLLDQRLFVFGWITETGLFAAKNCEKDAEKLLGLPAEDPNPPAEEDPQ